jgi:hypothetical protein
MTAGLIALMEIQGSALLLMEKYGKIRLYPCVSPIQQGCRTEQASLRERAEGCESG